jgi:hypothetical protein
LRPFINIHTNKGVSCSEVGKELEKELPRIDEAKMEKEKEEEKNVWEE